MAATTLLQDHLAPSVGKFLAKAAFGVPVLTDPLINYLRQRFASRREAKDAERQIERLVERCIAPLAPLFEREKDVNGAAVALALGATIERHVDVAKLLAEDLDRARVHAAALEARPLADLRQEAYGEANIALYRQALPRLLDQLIDLAPELKGFQGKEAAEVLRRLRALGEDAGAARTSSARIERWIEKQEQPWRDYGRDYCGYIETALDAVELFGIRADHGVKRQRLSAAFIPLSLSQDSDDEAEKGSTFFATLMHRLSPARPHLLITGPAGSGKTTLMRWAAIQAAGIAGNAEPADLGERLKGYLAEAMRARTAEDRAGRRGRSAMPAAALDLAAFPFAGLLSTAIGVATGAMAEVVQNAWPLRVPFLIPLRNCKGGKLPPPDEFTAIGTDYMKAPPAGWVQSILEDGRGLVLIDGIDEVHDAQREDIRHKLEALCNSFRGNYLVFTTRPGVIDDGWFATLPMMRAEVSPLGEHERTALIEHWHTAAAEQLTLTKRPDDASALAAALIEKLRGSPHVAQLGSNPLLCAAICALHYDRRGYLPKDQADICKSLCEMLIHRRDEEQGLLAQAEASDYGGLTSKHKAALIRDLAQASLRTGGAVIEADEAEKRIEQKLPALKLADLDARVIRDGLAKRSGILRAAFGGAIDFAHNTLRDYLAGTAFADDPGGYKEPLNNVDKEAWRLPIVFAAAEGGRSFAETLIAGLLQLPGLNARILAMLAEDAVIELDPGLSARVRGLYDDVFPPKTLEEAALLASLGDMVLDRLQPRKASKAVAHASARALRLIGTEKAKAVLRGYWQTKQAEVAEELAQLFNPLEIPFWQGRIQERNLPNGVAAVVSELGALAGLTGLRKLHLDNTRVRELGALAGLTGLRLLSLGNTQVRELGALAGVTGLRLLHLDNTQVSELGALAGLSGLETLVLANTQVRELGALAGVTGLRWLSLDNTRVSELGALAGVTGLRLLSLGNTQVRELGALAGLTGLETLVLANTRVSELGALAGLTGLRKLHLDNTQVSELGALAGLTGLRLLWLGNTPVTDLSPLDHIEGLKIIR